MKKLLYFIAALLLFTACNSDEPTINKGRLDPTAMVKIRGVEKSAQNSIQKTQTTGLTPLEVVQQCFQMRFHTQYESNNFMSKPIEMWRGFDAPQYDYETPALLMFGTDIIAQDGSYMKDFIYGHDMYIVDNNLDTIACIPDSVLNNARPLIEAAYNDSNFTEVYRLFNEAFIFIPL